jgi:hypothetical protein
MEHYIDYIDEEAIDRADKAYKEGKYNISTFYYESALYRLRKYNGDRMGAAYMASSLVQKLNKSREKLYRSPGMEVMESKPFKLSKTTFLKGKQCEKQLYLNKFNKGAATPPDKALLGLFKMGRSFESKFRNEKFPNGINIKDDLGNNIRHYASHTSNLLKSNEEITLFEAGFVFNDVLVLVDIVHKNKDGSIDLYEIKNNRELSKVILWDLAVQYYVCNQIFGPKINTFNAVFNKGLNVSQIRNLKKKLSKLEGEVKKDVKRFKEVLQRKTVPEISMGKQCDSFYTCEFKAHCTKTGQV